jgi:uncharacterized membrane protein YfcA
VDAAHLALVAAAGVAAGLVNAIAGGGSLITFPTLIACGVPALVANVTNTVALCPGYLGATFAQRRDLVGQRGRAARVLPSAALGGIAGALLLRATGEAVFEVLVPFLLVFASVLVLAQDRIRARLAARRRGHAELWAVPPVALASIYGGYFGAGMSVIVLAALAIVIDDALVRLNALKQAVALAANATAAIAFAIVGGVDWTVAAVMAAASLVGGVLGGAVASRVSQQLLRGLVVVIALAVAGYYFARL